MSEPEFTIAPPKVVKRGMFYDFVLDPDEPTHAPDFIGWAYELGGADRPGERHSAPDPGKPEGEQ